MYGGVFSERGLRQVARMLAGLAALAEAAAGRSFPVRWFVLALLRRAETVVRKALIDETGWSPADLEHWLGAGGDPDGQRGSGPADAAALAWRLRALAALLCAFLPDEVVPGCRETPNLASPRRLAPRIASSPAMPDGALRPAPDTS